MELRIFTLPFDPVMEGFPDELVKDFCINKKVQKLESQFFLQEGRASDSSYLSVSTRG